MRPHLLLLVALAGCQSLPPEDNRMRPGDAPTPFSAEEIRSGCPTGRTVKYLIRRKGEADVHHTIAFGEASDAGVRIDLQTSNLAGQPVEASQSSRPRWIDLQFHASFPEATTAVSSATYDTPAGSFDCWRYVLALPEEGRDEVHRFWFAKSLPGPPVRFEIEVDGELIYEMTLLENRLP